jgi:uncharacterized SAM-binding protein YcdF (DUF218 family)
MILRRFLSRALAGILALFLLWVGGLGLFLFSIPQNGADEQTVTEAIVVLTGGRERLKTGFDLLCHQRAKMIFISGVHPGENLKSLLKNLKFSTMTCSLDREQLISSTYLGYAAKNTRENAEETAKWVQKMSITSLRLVTAAYHMPRGLRELKHAIPHTTIIPHPVFPYGHDPFWWWGNGSAFYLIVSEYHKFLWGFVRMHLKS